MLEMADIFVSMKTLSKRELVRNPSVASHLKPGQSLQLKPPLPGPPLLRCVQARERSLAVGESPTETTESVVLPKKALQAEEKSSHGSTESRPTVVHYPNFTIHHGAIIARY